MKNKYDIIHSQRKRKEETTLSTQKNTKILDELIDSATELPLESQD